MHRAFFILFFTTVSYSQIDPYKLEFENDWVRVSRISYPPFGKSQTHSHPALPTIYVYTTDGGPMSFMHADGVIVDRPAVQAGGIRFNRGAYERHSVESTSDKPSEYLRIELKTEPLELPRQDIRIAPSEARNFENAQVKLVKSVCAPRQKCGGGEGPRVVVTLHDGKVTWVNDGLPGVENSSDQPISVIQIELKSPPKTN